VAAVALTGIATAVTGLRFASKAPRGAVPLDDGSHPASNTPQDAARLKRRLNALSTASGVAALALVGVNAALGKSNFRRLPVRRVLRRKY
jgi:hypothetical protein